MARLRYGQKIGGGKDGEVWVIANQVFVGGQRSIKGIVFRMAYDREVSMLEWIALLLKSQREKLVAPKLVHASLKWTLDMFRMFNEEGVVGLGDVPVTIMADIMVIAGLFML